MAKQRKEVKDAKITDIKSNKTNAEESVKQAPKQTSSYKSNQFVNVIVSNTEIKINKNVDNLKALAFLEMAKQTILNQVISKK